VAHLEGRPTVTTCPPAFAYRATAPPRRATARFKFLCRSLQRPLHHRHQQHVEIHLIGRTVGLLARMKKVVETLRGVSRHQEQCGHPPWGGHVRITEKRASATTGTSAHGPWARCTTTPSETAAAVMLSRTRRATGTLVACAVSAFAIRPAGLLFASMVNAYVRRDTVAQLPACAL